MSAENILYKKLAAKAEQSLRQELNNAGDDFKRGLGLYGANKTIYLKTNAKETVEINFYVLIDQLIDLRFKELIDARVSKEIRAFINSVEVFTRQVDKLKEFENFEE